MSTILTTKLTSADFTKIMGLAHVVSTLYKNVAPPNADHERFDTGEFQMVIWYNPKISSVEIRSPKHSYWMNYGLNDRTGSENFVERGTLDKLIASLPKVEEISV